MARTRTQTWLAVILAPLGLLVVAIPAMWLFMKTTATVLHPDVQDVPSEALSTPAQRWANAVEQAQQLVRTSLNQENLPGLSVAVGVSGDIVWAEGFGFADIDKRLLLTPKHKLRIGTASTVLTAGAAGILVEEGRLKLDEPVRTYVPAFPAKAWPVTLRRLMGHTAGLITDEGDESTLYSRHCAGPADGLQYFADNALLFEPGTRFYYSRYGWILVSAAVEAVAGKPLTAFIEQRIFNAAGMRDTMAEPTPRTAVADQVTLYFPRFSADPRYGLHLMRDLDLSCYSGASVFLSTPSDLVRYGMAVQGGKLLKQSTVEMLQTSQRLISGAETGYGLGWDIGTVPVAGKPARSVGHDGDLLGGRMASLLTLPEQGVTVAVLSNISYADTSTLAAKIAGVFAVAHVPTEARP